jgi:hypothetical protein
MKVDDAPDPVSCSWKSRAMACTGISLASVRTCASNNTVKPLPGRAQGTSTCRTPQLSHRIRGNRAVSTVSYCQKFRWRQRLGSTS